jgi:glutaredoxin
MQMIVYTKDSCPACVALKARLSREGESFTEVNIGKDITREAFMEMYPTVRQVPHVVFVKE